MFIFIYFEKKNKDRHVYDLTVRMHSVSRMKHIMRAFVYKFVLRYRKCAHYTFHAEKRNVLLVSLSRS